jgi:uncharacterized protein
LSSFPDISCIASRIVEAVHPTRIYLFGSRANGSARPDSDVDLLVVYDGQLDYMDAQMAMRRALRPREYSLDLLLTTSEKFERYKHVVNTIASEVAEKGVLIYG